MNFLEQPNIKRLMSALNLTAIPLELEKLEIDKDYSVDAIFSRLVELGRIGNKPSDFLNLVEFLDESKRFKFSGNWTNIQRIADDEYM